MPECDLGRVKTCTHDRVNKEGAFLIFIPLTVSELPITFDGFSKILEVIYE